MKKTQLLVEAFRFLVLSVLWAAAVQGATAPPTRHDFPVTGIDWDSNGFSLNGIRTDAMWVNRIPSLGDPEQQAATYSKDVVESIQPLGMLELSPAATVLSYGQALFEGLKAFRRQDGSIALFRPEKNAQRMQEGARRFLMPPVPTDVFVEAADAVVRANSRWVPPYQKGALYLRPILMGSGPGLGVKPSEETTFCIYCSPVGNYFKAGLKAIRVQAVKGFSRAARGGSGGIKASGNYAPAFLVQKQVRERGYDEVLCLDAVTGEALEEAGASNFFAVFPNNTLVTPCLKSETILPGVTRMSIIELASKECGCHVIEGRLTVADLKQACEAFCCGTGACITPVGSVSVTNEEGEESDLITFRDGNTGELTRKLYNMLTAIQSGADPELTAKYDHWIHVVEP